MTENTPSEGGLSAEDALKIADNLFGHALRILDTHLQELEAQEGAGAMSTARAGQDVRKAIQIFFDERAKVEHFRNKTSGGVTGGVIDLDAARDEIGRRLACLRDTK